MGAVIPLALSGSAAATVGSLIFLASGVTSVVLLLKGRGWLWWLSLLLAFIPPWWLGTGTSEVVALYGALVRERPDSPWERWRVEGDLLGSLRRDDRGQRQPGRRYLIFAALLAVVTMFAVGDQVIEPIWPPY